jgi:hypothetical protein
MEEIDEKFVELWHRANDAGLGPEVCFYAIKAMKEQRLDSIHLAMQIAIEDWDL